MFDSKKTGLESRTVTSGNAFLDTGTAIAEETLSGNGAYKYKSTDNVFVTQFGSASGYKEPRAFKDVMNDMSVLWKTNSRLTVCFTLFLRTVTRVVQLFNGSSTKEVQKGLGLKHEGIFRMMWLQINHPTTFWKNIELFISVGSWKDIITMLQYDLVYNDWKGRQLDWNNIGKLLLAGLENPNTSELIKKYLPQIRANSDCTTVEAQADSRIGKWLCSLLFGGKGDDDSYEHYVSYRKLKSGGTAHEWQKLISQRNHRLVDFNTIHGRALATLVSSGYIEKQGLSDAYQKWIDSKPVAKFTGYVYELANQIAGARAQYQIQTINKQYQGMLDLAKGIKGEYIVVKDTSGSMDRKAIGTTMSSYHVAKSLSIYLGNLLEGRFHNHYIDFASKALLRQIQGSTFVEHWNTEKRVASANTNFLAVAELFVQIRSTVEESEFPTGIICISDGEFDEAKIASLTNVQNFRQILSDNGFSDSFVSNFKIVFWDIRNDFYGSKYANTKFETRKMEDNVFYFGGFDGSVVSFLTGKKLSDGTVTKAPKNAEEVFMAAMNQEILDKVVV